MFGSLYGDQDDVKTVKKQVQEKVADPLLVEQLITMGFPVNLVKKAAVKVNAGDTMAAIDIIQ